MSKTGGKVFFLIILMSYPLSGFSHVSEAILLQPPFGSKPLEELLPPASNSFYAQFPKLSDEINALWKGQGKQCSQALLDPERLTVGQAFAQIVSNHNRLARGLFQLSKQNKQSPLLHQVLLENAHAFLLVSGGLFEPKLQHIERVMAIYDDRPLDFEMTEKTGYTHYMLETSMMWMKWVGLLFVPNLTSGRFRLIERYPNARQKLGDLPDVEKRINIAIEGEYEYAPGKFAWIEIRHATERCYPGGPTWRSTLGQISAKLEVLQRLDPTKSLHIFLTGAGIVPTGKRILKLKSYGMLFPPKVEIFDDIHQPNW